MFKCVAAVEPEARDAANSEIHRQDVALVPAGEVGRGLKHTSYLAIRKSSGVESCGFEGVIVKPEADRIFGFHGLLNGYTGKALGAVQGQIGGDYGVRATVGSLLFGRSAELGTGGPGRLASDSHVGECFFKFGETCFIEFDVNAIAGMDALNIRLVSVTGRV